MFLDLIFICTVVYLQTLLKIEQNANLKSK